MFGIEDSIKESLIEMIHILLSSMSTVGNQIASPLSQNAGQYSQSALNMVMSIAENVVLPVAGVMFTYVVVNDLIEMLTAQNNMHEHTPQDLFKWIFKTAIGISLISNSFTISNAIIEVGAVMVRQAIPYADVGEVALMTFEADATLMEMTISGLLMIIISLAFTLLVTALGIIVVHLFIIARFFEIYMYLAVSPIPFSTLMSGQLNHTGITYLKNLIALAIQAVIILVSFSIYSTVSATYTMNAVVNENFAIQLLSGGGAVVQGIVLILVLVIMVWRSRGISKDIVGS